MPAINPDRLLADLYHLRSFGAHDTGVVRPSLSAIDMKARHWLAGQMSGAGLDTAIDGIGNVFGRTRNPGKPLLIGSHSDTQPTGGWLDGALGVIYAIEVARTLAENPDCSSLPLDTVAWVDEESTFTSCLGSRAFSGLLRPDEMKNARNDAGQSLHDALQAAGLDGVPSTPQPGHYRGYLEAHIEQGPHLEASGKHIGVVTAIVGARNFTVYFTGKQNHAGTTPMPLRQDAAIALMNFGSRINEGFIRVAGPKSVWTMGRLEVFPGASSIIPGAATLHLQFRDPEDAMLDTLQHEAQALVASMNETGPVRVRMEEFTAPTRPARMNDRFQHHLAGAAQLHAPDDWISMPSAAVHDAMFVARLMPAGMLFIPSIGGVSHDFSENTDDADIVRGCQVFATAVSSILKS